MNGPKFKFIPGIIYTVRELVSRELNISFNTRVLGLVLRYFGYGTRREHSNLDLELTSGHFDFAIIINLT